MENFIVSARKYRPATFETVVGQKSITSTLKNAIKSSHLAHAYLFCGPRGVGKTTCARIFAKTINCANLNENIEACEKCESCKSFNENRSFNIHELDAASNNSVDDIRHLIDQVRIPPQIGKHSVYIIDEVHMLSSQAFNAFLKTLEEPPVHATFILATTEKHKIIPTILSRCQIFDFNRIRIEDIVHHLSYVAKKEDVTAEPDALNIIAQKADGGMRDALSYFDQIVSYSGNEITYKHVIDNLNVMDYDYYFRLTSSFLEGNVAKALMIFNDILNKGFDGHHFITGLSGHFRDLLVCLDTVTLELLEVGANIRENYKNQSKQCNIDFLIKALEITSNCDINFKNSYNQRLHVELALLQLCNMSAIKKKTELDSSQTEKEESSNDKLTQNQAIGQKQSVSSNLAQSKDSKTSVETDSIKKVKSPSLSISDAMKEKFPPIVLNKETQTEVSKVSDSQQADYKQITPVTAEELRKVWLKFAEIHKSKTRLYNTLVTHIPKLTDNFVLRFSLSNGLQQDAINEIKNEMLAYLKAQLRNSEISVEMKIEENDSSKLPFTAQDKYKLLNEKNPNLSDLKQRFDLEL